MKRNKSFLLFAFAVATILLSTAQIEVLAANTGVPGSNTETISMSELSLRQPIGESMVTFDCQAVSQIPAAECQALVALYNSTNGPHWINRSGWLANNTPCSWYGVSCSQGRVQNLYLFSNGLTGALPPEVGDLTRLYGLALPNNQLTGSIPSTISSISTLFFLYLENNQLEGSIPAALESLHNLQILHLYNNRLSGGIPAQLGLLSRLEELRLHNNGFTGDLPAELGNLARLKELWLWNNPLAGPLPLSLTNLQQLTSFFYSRTGLCEPSDPVFQSWLSQLGGGQTAICGSVDMGFRPQPDGYSFSNSSSSWGTYPLPPALDDFTTADMRVMFGDEAVCQMTGDICIVRGSALQWNFVVNQKMSSGGHCFGMSTTSLRFYKQLGPSPSYFQNNATTTYDLQLNNARRNISYYHALQWTNPLAGHVNQALSANPLTVLRQVRQALLDGAPNPVALVVVNGTAGHAVVPSAIEDRGDGVYWIKLYDSNFPDDFERHLEISTMTETWTYDGGTIYSGTRTSGNLGILPLSNLIEEPHGWTRHPAAPWVSDGMETSQVWLLGDGHLLISDQQGRRIGFIGSQFVNEMPDAYANVSFGGLGVESEPIYTLPAFGTRRILVDGQTLSDVGTVSVTQFGPGYAATAGELVLGPTSRDWMSISPNGSQIAYEANSSKAVTLTLAVDDVEGSGQFQVRDADIEANGAFTLTVDAAQGTLVLANVQGRDGTYDLDIRLVDQTGTRRFFAKDVAILGGDTQYADYGMWSGWGPMALRIDHGSNGTIDETLSLNNEAGRVFLPVVQRRR